MLIFWHIVRRPDLWSRQGVRRPIIRFGYIKSNLEQTVKVLERLPCPRPALFNRRREIVSNRSGGDQRRVAGGFGD
jgi:hypothetical protein